ALGCPVIASRVSGAEEQLEDAALLFDPADPEDLVSAILTISQDQQLRARMVQKGAEIAKTRTPQAYVEQVCKISDKLAASRACWVHEYKHTQPPSKPAPVISLTRAIAASSPRTAS